MPNICAACGKPNANIGMGGVILCTTCSVDVREEAERLRAEGKPVDMAKIALKMFREQYSVGGYLLRDIPEDLWTSAKHRAVDEGLSLRELILKALRLYLEKPQD